jgi:RNA polymerase sigma factor for flagellar operon FliA
MANEPEQEKVQQLIEKYLPYAEALARSLRTQLPGNVEMEEILSLARMGLVDAAQRYDESRRVSFKTYAYYRIRGTIFDGVRASGPTTRGEVAKYKFRKSMDMYMQQEVDAWGTSPAGLKAINLGEFKNLMFVMTSIYLLSLDSSMEHMEIPSHAVPSPHEEMEKSEALSRLKRLTTQLSEQEQHLLRMYYYENRTLDEIGHELKLSRSWVCRMHSRALKKLQKLFQNADKAGRTSIRV